MGIEPVMRKRWLLDYLAAFQTLILNRNLGDCKAIFKARKAFQAWKHDFDQDRRDSGEQGGGEYSSDSRLFYSVAERYYARGKKFFSQL